MSLVSRVEKAAIKHGLKMNHHSISDLWRKEPELEPLLLKWLGSHEHCTRSLFIGSFIKEATNDKTGL